MFFAPRISGSRLAELCHRLSVALAAGVDIRKAWQRETAAMPVRYRSDFAKVETAINHGASLTESLAKTGKLFPPLFIEMVGVGERTGQTAEVLKNLADHYQMRVKQTRAFLGLLAWPLLQLMLAVFVIGLLIWILGALGANNLDGTPIDVLGFGVVGSQGLLLFASFVAACSAIVVGLVIAARRGMLWVRPLQCWVTRMPGLGTAIQKICLARISWTLHLLLNVEMDLRELVPLVLRSTGNEFYIQRTDQMVAAIEAGKPLYLTFAESLAFPPPFLDALAVAEESGQISESMARLAKQYESEAESAMSWIAMIAGLGVWILVGSMMVYMIFRLFTQLYLKPIRDALDM